tara:strand:+ start:127 stop:627 length:501 start_codon:yes stop_codon:yes gene_type:complete
MTTNKVNENWWKCSDTNKVEIQAFTRYLDENHNPVKVGGFTIEMGFTIYETWADFHINVIDANDKLKDQIVIKTTLDQIIKVKPSKPSIIMSDKDKKKLKHSIELGRFEFFSFRKNTTIMEEKLFDESEVKKAKEHINQGKLKVVKAIKEQNQIDLEELINEKKGA